jgi:HAD superfamily hydrolase (TIGR01509 family)
MKTKLVLFDMDGVLIDSEPHWNKAMMTGFKSFGVSLSSQQVKETMGSRLNEAVDYWVSRFPALRPSQAALESAILEDVSRRIDQEANLFDGVEKVLEGIHQLGIPAVIASSSPHSLIEIVRKKFSRSDFFAAVFSAQDDTYGKPHPAIYIRSAEFMGVSPEACWVIEDSVHGMVSAKAAKMKVIVIPDSETHQDKRWGLADIHLGSMKEFSMDILI